MSLLLLRLELFFRELLRLELEIPIVQIKFSRLEKNVIEIKLVTSAIQIFNAYLNNFGS